MKNEYSLLTHCSFQAPAKAVWDVTVDVKAYPDWWPCIHKVVMEGHPSNLQEGSNIHYTIKGFLPHTLQFQTYVTRCIPFRRIEMTVSGGLEGAGISLLEEHEGLTLATFRWDVAITSPILNHLSQYRLFHRLFAWNHDFVMRSAVRNMRKQVSCAAA